MPKFGQPMGALLSPFSARRTRMPFDDVTVRTSVAAITPTANLITYQPISFGVPQSITAFAWANGTTLTGPPKITMGIYSADGTLLGTTSASGTAQSGTSVMQTAAPVGGTFNVGSGLYYLAFASDTATAGSVTGQALSNAAMGRVAGMLMQASGLSSNTLPAFATFAALTDVNIPECGVVADPIGNSSAGYYPATITPFSNTSIGSLLGPLGSSGLAAGTSGANSSASRATYFPIVIPSPIVLTQGFFLAGTTSSSSNHWDIGIYGQDGTQLVHAGAIAQDGNTSTLQVTNITDTEIGPGICYMALVLDSTDHVFARALTVAVASLRGMRSQATAYQLPAFATFAAVNAATLVPLFGFTTQPTV